MFDISNLYPGRRQRNAEATEQRRRDCESVTVRGFLADEAEEAARIEAERLAAVKAAEAELSRNLTALRNEERTRALNLTDDNSIFVDPDEPRWLAQAEADAYNREQIGIFLRENPSYYPDLEGKNLQSIGAYLQRNDQNGIVSAKKLTQVFQHLTRLGLLIPRPAPVAEPEPVQAVVPAAPARKKLKIWPVNEYPFFQDPGGKATDLIEGWDPLGSGERFTLTRREVERLSLTEFKYFARPTVQATPDWARVEARSKVADQFTYIRNRY